MGLLFKKNYLCLKKKKKLTFILSNCTQVSFQESFQEASFWLLFQFLPFPNPPSWPVTTTLAAQMLLLSLLHSFFIISPSKLFSPLLISFFSLFVSQVTIFMLHLALKFSFELLCHGWEGQTVRDDRETRSYKCENEI